MFERWKMAHFDLERSSRLIFGISHNPVVLKCKYATDTEIGHWRVEVHESICVSFLFWMLWIRFYNTYWDNWCDKRNSENGYSHSGKT